MQTKCWRELDGVARSALGKGEQSPVIGTQPAIEAIPYMGYVLNSDYGLEVRGSALCKAVSEQRPQFPPIFRPIALPSRSQCDLVPGALRSRTGRRNGIGKLVVALFVFLTLYFSINAAFPSEPLHYQLASDPNLHGKGKDGECMDYALALSSRLAEHGIHGRLIFYRWHMRGTETDGSHVFIFYRLPDNSEWIVDNEIPHPRRVPACASLMDLVFFLSDNKTAPVDVELQNRLNHLSFF